MPNPYRRGGFYCSGCGACFTTAGWGVITCQKCGQLGLRQFTKMPRSVTCPKAECDWRGWDDGGVNDDLGRHLRREHKAPA